MTYEERMAEVTAWDGLSVEMLLDLVKAAVRAARREDREEEIEEDLSHAFAGFTHKAPEAPKWDEIVAVDVDGHMLIAAVDGGYAVEYTEAENAA